MQRRQSYKDLEEEYSGKKVVSVHLAWEGAGFLVDINEVGDVTP